MAQMSVSQALVLSTMTHIMEGRPVSGKDVSGEKAIVLTGAALDQVLKVLGDFVREPAFRSPAEQMRPARRFG
jgi:hypothetical protein